MDDIKRITAEEYHFAPVMISTLCPLTIFGKGVVSRTDANRACRRRSCSLRRAISFSVEMR